MNNTAILPQIQPITNKQIKNITGQRFGRLTVLGYVGIIKKVSNWLCQCDCGTQTVAVFRNLRCGDTQSCGCLHRETVGDMSRTHGMSQTKLFARWQAMRKRCYYKNLLQYPDYGGRGIKVCDRWQSFENFYADMGDPPSDKHSIDRIDNNGDYCPENCRWATRSEQNNNARRNHILEYNGESMTIAQWEQRLGFKQGVLRNRINALGWNIERALTTPVKK
jgi:hypothetical protein